MAALLIGAMCVTMTACGSKAEDTAKEETPAAAETETTAESEEGTADASAEIKTVSDGVLTMGTNAAFPPYEFYDGDKIVGIETTAESEEGTADASAEIKTVSDGVLTMGTNAAFPPYEFYDGDKIVGIDTEIAEALAAKLGLKLEVVDMDFAAIVTAVQSFPPYEFYDGDKIVGIDTEIAEALAAKLGLKLEVVDMDFAAIVTAVQSGKVDVGIAGMTVDEERLKNVDFTNSYATGVQAIIVTEDSEIASVDDLEGKLIGVQEGTTSHMFCADDYGDDSVIAYTNGATAVQALLQGKVDCVVVDEQPAISFVEANEGLKILDTKYAVEDYAIAVAKENTALKDALNTAMQELKDDGTIQGILDKYIKAE